MEEMNTAHYPLLLDLLSLDNTLPDLTCPNLSWPYLTYLPGSNPSDSKETSFRHPPDNHKEFRHVVPRTYFQSLGYMPWKCLYSSFPGIEYECMAGLHNMVGWRDHATPLPPYAKICLDSPFVGGGEGGKGGGWVRLLNMKLKLSLSKNLSDCDWAW